MLILTVRTDKPEAELGLFENDKQLDYFTWQAHRELAETVHLKLKALLDAHGKDVHQIKGLVIFAGPGSFTGLRIGIAVANALSSSLSIPIVSGSEPRWLEAAIQRLLNGENDHLVLPEYGAPVHITQAKK